MPPHNLATISRPRTLADVLHDLRHALRDYHDALSATDEDAEDRATAFERQVEDLRDEFDRTLRNATGLSVEDIRSAYSEALI